MMVSMVIIEPISAAILTLEIGKVIIEPVRLYNVNRLYLLVLLGNSYYL